MGGGWREIGGRFVRGEFSALNRGEKLAKWREVVKSEPSMQNPESRRKSRPRGDEQREKGDGDWGLAKRAGGNIMVYDKPDPKRVGPPSRAIELARPPDASPKIAETRDFGTRV